MIKTLILGLDGATWQVLDPLLRRGLMPNLAALVEGGARAPLRSVMPPLTPPGWTSLMTGRTPAHHGVFDFFRRESPDSEFFRLTTADDIDGETIWSLASAAGQRVLSLNFPVMFPAPPVRGRVVPGGWMPWRQLRLGCYPAGLFDRLKQLPSFDPKELALDMTLEAKAVEGCPAEEYDDWVELHIRREQRWCEVAETLLDDEPAELVGIVFDGVDKLQHLCWRYLDPDSTVGGGSEQDSDHARSEQDRAVRAACERYFVSLDGIIERLVRRAGPEALVVVASDHGFGGTDELFYVNAWLAEQGFLSWADHGPTTASTDVGFAQMARHVTLLDWDHTLAYAATPSSQGIHVVAKDPRTGAATTPAARDRICADLTAALQAARHPRTGAPLVSRVWSGTEAFGTDYAGVAPDVALELYDGMAFSIIRSDETVRARDEQKGNHRWLGVCAVSGPGVRAGAELAELSICDVAPIVLRGLGLDAPTAVDGRLPTELFDDAPALTPVAGGFIASFVDTADDPTGPEHPDTERRDSSTDDAYDPESEALVVSRLRSLGYLD